MSEIIDKIYKHYEKQPTRFSRRIGASGIGKECARAIWYGFRWALKPKIEGRILRLFERGQNEEAIVVKNLRDAGYDVYDVDQNGKQFDFEDASVDGHFGGKMDGCINIDDIWHVLEVKTSSEKRFNPLVKQGLNKTFPEYYAQCQCYMGWSGMKKTLFYAVNKNDDRMYTEIVEFNAADFKVLQTRARNIIQANEPPIRISKDPTYFKCKWCDYYYICHMDHLPESNCRNCCHSSHGGSAKWFCEKHNKELSLDEQKKGCGQHLFIPPMINAEVVDVDPDCIIYKDGDIYLANMTEDGFPPLNDEYKDAKIIMHGFDNHEMS